MGNVVVSYEYDAWGKVYSVTGSMAGTLATINPIRYRSYYYDTETGFYYLNSRYYDPETSRFINADGYVSTGQGISGTNMFAYCENNPVSRSDPNGNLWRGVAMAGVSGLSAIYKGNAFTDFLLSVFGAGSSTTTTISETKVEYLPDPLPITAETGTRTKKTVSKHGDSSKPVSVYSNLNSNNPLLSSAGLKINISDFTFNINLALDNIGVYGSIADGDRTDSFGIRANLSEFKVGFEGTSAVKWDNDITQETYTNASVNGGFLIAACMLVTTGLPVPPLSYAY